MPWEQQIILLMDPTLSSAIKLHNCVLVGSEHMSGMPKSEEAIVASLQHG